MLLLVQRRDRFGGLAPQRLKLLHYVRDGLARGTAHRDRRGTDRHEVLPCDLP
ncbi:hypothetical protein D3C71_2004970 [compost metagenome]